MTALSSELSNGQGPSSPIQSPASNSEPKTALIPQIRFVPHNTSYARSLHFDALTREFPPQTILKVGRYTDKVKPSPTRLAFKSKVVSRSHAEIWTENGQFYLKDTKSSSGTFLNQQRLSPPNQESPPTTLKDGDILQLGVDYQGGSQEMFRCVRIRLEINRTWQHDQHNPFRQKALQTLEALKKSLKTHNSLLNNTNDLDECCICLSSLAPFQALFVAPCSHTFHYKCIHRLLIEGPSFVCPLCRTYADLDADVCTEELASPMESLSLDKDMGSAPDSSSGLAQPSAAASSSPSSESPPITASMPPSGGLVVPNNGDLTEPVGESTLRTPSRGSSLDALDNEEPITGCPGSMADCVTPSDPEGSMFFAAGANSPMNNSAQTGITNGTTNNETIRSASVGEVRI